MWQVKMKTLGRRRSWPTALLFLPLLPLLCASSPSQSILHLNRYTLRSTISNHQPQEPQEYIEPTYPPILLDGDPVCSLQLLDQDFAYTYGSPPAHSNFTISDTCRWNRAVLELSAACAGEQYDRIGAVWVDGVELLRTSTPEPTEWGIFWTVRKDVTRYSSLFNVRSSPHHVWVMLENIVNDVYTGVYHLNLKLHLYQEDSSSEPRSRALLGAIPLENSLRSPADLILPVTRETGSSDGFWFRIQSEDDANVASVDVPKNSYRAVLEIYASSHGYDEFWYANPPSYYIERNHISPPRGNGAFREVSAAIDGLYAGSILPFPVIFTGGFNPLLWAPVTPLASFDLPSYLLDVTPFLGILLNGSSHQIGLSVSHSLPFWLVSASLHLWLDPDLNAVSSNLARHRAPPALVSYRDESNLLDGSFKLEAERTARFEGWVSSSLGNLTYYVNQEFKYKSSISYAGNGTCKEVRSKTKYKTETRVGETPDAILFKVYQKGKYPVEIKVVTEEGFARTNVSHGMTEKTVLSVGSAVEESSLSARQDAGGWMEFKDHEVLAGSGSSQQRYKSEKCGGCFVRVVTADGGFLSSDQNSTDCRFGEWVDEERRKYEGQIIG